MFQGIFFVSLVGGKRMSSGEWSMRLLRHGAPSHTGEREAEEPG